MTDRRAFHHGNLRAVLLDEALKAVREAGAESLSLRALARRAGVSHAAPRHHFSNHRVLMDALAVEGFRILLNQLQQAAEGENLREHRFHAVARKYVQFAIDEANLLEVMFAYKSGHSASADLEMTASALFDWLSAFLVEHSASVDRVQHPQTRPLVLVATLQGIASLVVSGRLPIGQVDALIVDVADLFDGAR